MQEYKVLKLFKDNKGKWHRPTTTVTLSDKDALRQRRLGHVMLLRKPKPVKPEVVVPVKMKSVKKRKPKNEVKK